MKITIFATKTLIIFSLAMFLFVFSGCSDIAANEEDALLVEYFYFNVCVSCDPENEFLEKFEELTSISASSPNIEIKMYNTYNEEGKKHWEEIAEKHKISYHEQTFPVLVVDDKLKNISGDASYLDSNLRNELPNKDLTILKSSSVIVYFSSPGCHNCIEIKEEVLSHLPKEIIIDKESSPVKLIEISISQTQNTKLFKKYCEKYNVPKESQQTPIIFAGYDYLVGAEEISYLPDLLAKGKCQNTPVFEVTTNNKNDLLSEYRLLSVFTTGLLNGLNPCAISMVLMLLSLLAINKKLILPIGLSFAVGKFIGFFFWEQFYTAL